MHEMDAACNTRNTLILKGKIGYRGGGSGILRLTTYNHLFCYLYAYYFHNVWVKRVGNL